jgi:predicted ArsR family transcriptional regulator
MRISIEDKLQRRELILKTLCRNDGLTEAELTQALGLERRTINNHLRWLQETGQARKTGLIWYANVSKSAQLIDKIIVLLNELKQELENDPTL